jgi:hypothetical protein
MLSICILVGACGSSGPDLTTKIYINEATDASGLCLYPGAKYQFEGIIGPPKSMATLRAAHSIPPGVRLYAVTRPDHSQALAEMPIKNPHDGPPWNHEAGSVSGTCQPNHIVSGAVAPDDGQPPNSMRIRTLADIAANRCDGNGASNPNDYKPSGRLVVAGTWSPPAFNHPGDPITLTESIPGGGQHIVQLALSQNPLLTPSDIRKYDTSTVVIDAAQCFYTAPNPDTGGTFAVLAVADPYVVDDCLFLTIGPLAEIVFADVNP